MDSHATLLSLPVLCLENIFCHVVVQTLQDIKVLRKCSTSHDNIAKLAQVCRLFNYVAKRKVIWKRVDIIFSQPCHKLLFSSPYAMAIQELQILKISHLEDEKDRLNVQWLDQYFLESLAITCPQLTTLSIPATREPIDPEYSALHPRFPESIYLVIPTLKTLVLEGEICCTSVSSVTMQGMNNLSYLCVHGCNSLEEVALVDSKPPSHVHMSNCSFSTQILAYLLPTTENLCISNGEQSFLQELFPALNAGRQHFIDRVIMSSIAFLGSNLTTLVLEETDCNCCDLLILADTCPKLQALQFSKRISPNLPAFTGPAPPQKVFKSLKRVCICSTPWMWDTETFLLSCNAPELTSFEFDFRAMQNPVFDPKNPTNFPSPMGGKLTSLVRAKFPKLKHKYMSRFRVVYLDYLLQKKELQVSGLCWDWNVEFMVWQQNLVGVRYWPLSSAVGHSNQRKRKRHALECS